MKLTNNTVNDTVHLSVWEMGRFDQYGRFFLFDQYQTWTSDEVQHPSKKYPHSILRHIHTKKYAKELAYQMDVPTLVIEFPEEMPDCGNFSWEDSQYNAFVLEQLQQGKDYNVAEVEYIDFLTEYYRLREERMAKPPEPISDDRFEIEQMLYAIQQRRAAFKLQGCE